MNNALIPEEIIMSFDDDQDINLDIDDSTKAGDYPPLTNKPKINNVTLLGNKTSAELGLQDNMDEITPQDIDKIIYGE